MAILVSAVVAFIIGFLFHGPLFGKLWMKLANITPTGNEKMSDMYSQMFWNLVANIVTALGIAVLINLTANSIYMLDNSLACVGMICATIVWAGFIVPGSSMEVIWMKKSYKLWIFECIATLASFLAMGAIIGVWY